MSVEAILLRARKTEIVDSLRGVFSGAGVVVGSGVDEPTGEAAGNAGVNLLGVAWLLLDRSRQESGGGYKNSGYKTHSRAAGTGRCHAFVMTEGGEMDTCCPQRVQDRLVHVGDGVAIRPRRNQRDVGT